MEQAGSARPDRVFLFPRAAAGVAWFERELAVYQALAQTRLDIVPRLLGRWEDPEAYPFPFAAVTRLRGEVAAEPAALIGQLGQAIARWHDLEPPAVPAWAGLLARAARLAPVLVHGDIHEDQLLSGSG